MTLHHSEAREHLLNGASRLLVCSESVNEKCQSDYIINNKNVIAYITRFYEERKKRLDKIHAGSDKSGNIQIDHRLFMRLLLKLKSSEQSLYIALLATFPYINQHKKASKSQESVNWRQLT